MSKAGDQRLETRGSSPDSEASSLWPLASSLLRAKAGRLAFVLATSLTGTVLSLFIPYLSKDLVDRALLGRDAQSLLTITGLFVVITAISFLLNMVSGLAYTRVSAEILFDMRLALYRHLQRLSPRFYARTRLGEIVSRINGDIGEIQRVAAETALAWVGNVLFLVGTAAIMLWLDVRLFLVSMALLPLSIWALTYYRTRLEGRVAALRQAGADIGSFLIETLQGVKLIAASNAQEREVARFRGKNQAFIDSLMSMQRLSYLAGGLPGLLLSVGTMAVFLYGGQRVIDGTLSLGAFVAFLAYQMRLLSPIQALMGLYAALAGARVSLGRVRELFDTKPEVVEQLGAASLPRATGNIRFEQVSFTFDRSTPVLEGLDLEVKAGETLAIVGPSGSGKSTIADLLLRLLDPDRGVIRLDGHDLRTLRLEDLRRHVALVDQETFVFHATIAENIRYARPDAGDDQVERAARAAGLDLDLSVIVGERGMALSGGERQRLAIARAFLADPVVLVLDEATSSLDPALERQVITGYGALMQGRTTILITHRFDLACSADRVVVLDGASIVEQGVPRELQAQNSAFARLFIRQ